MLVSIIIPCYNYAHFLGEALESVLHQTYTNWECIIINDGSPDNTAEISSAYCKKDSRFIYFLKENGGHSAARNFGIKKSSGKYILPLDADDKISADYVRAAVELMEADLSLKLVTGKVQLFGTNEQILSMPTYDLRSYLISNYICISSLFRKTDFEQAGGFDETMLGFEDWDLFIRLLKGGGEVQQLPFTCLYYRQKETSVFENVKQDRKILFRDLLKLYTNNSDIYGQYFLPPSMLIQENEKMSSVIQAYQRSTTYKVGLFTKKVRRLFKS